MKSNHRNIIRSTAEYTRCFDSLRGVSYTADNQDCFSELENMYVDYSSGADAVESVPGYRRVASLGANIHGIYPQHTSAGEDFIVVHAGSSLYRIALSDIDSAEDLSPIATVADTDGCGKSLNGTIVLFLDSLIHVVAEDGSVSVVNPSSTATLYEPTIYRNGEPYEDRNMLTNNYKEVYTVKDVRDVLRGTPQLTYGSLNEAEMSCAVTGITEGYDTTVYIPSRVRLPSGVYTVTHIAPGALCGTSITDLIVNREVRSIGSYAFGSCTSLQTVRLSASVESIADDAFSGCGALTTVYLGAALSRIGERAFSGCDNLSEVHYALDGTAFSQIEGHECFSDGIMIYRSAPTDVRLAIPIYGSMVSLYTVYINGRISRDHTYDLNEKYIFFTAESEKAISSRA